MSHLWIAGEAAQARRAEAATIDLPEIVAPVDAHRRLRGPYTAAGTLLRDLAPRLLSSAPDLVATHDIELLSVAPELREVVPASRETLTSLAVPEERTRFYSRLRTLRIAHGLADLLRGYLARAGEPRQMLVIENADHADPTDAELLAVWLRRLDPALLTLVVCTGQSATTEELDAALRTYAVRRLAAAPDPTPSTGDDAGLAAAYVRTDCTSDDTALIAAYDRLESADRVRLHDARADELEALGEWSLRLGAVPYHRERGSDPAGSGARSMRAALDYCVDMGFYHATIDFGRRGRAVIDWAAQEEMWWAFTTKMTTSLAALSRAEEAEALYDEVRAYSTNPKVHLQAAYATAMLYTRHHAPERQHHRLAKGWINEAIAIAALLPDTGDRAFELAFQRNGLALIETHLGNLPEALRLVEDGIARLDRELDADRHRLHRSVLQHNRARVLVGLGRLPEAIEAYDAVIAADPNYAEYHFDRGNLLHRLGRDPEALAAYAAAIGLSPPFPELYYNRADVALGLGDEDASLADLSYVLELDPTYVDAYVNRAGVLVARGDLDAARRDVDAGLKLAPDHPHLHCLLGQLYAEAGQAAEAEDAYRRALELDASLASAWAGLATLAHQAGDARSAVEHLTRALAQGEDAALRYNRAVAHRSAGRYADALTDLDEALRADPGDEDAIAQREACLADLGRQENEAAPRTDFDDERVLPV